MDIEKRSTRFGAAIILFAVILRLSGLVLPVLAQTLRLTHQEHPPDWTGRGPHTVVSAAKPTLPTWPQPTQPPPTQGIAPQIPVFDQSQAALVHLRYASDCALRADLPALLQKPLLWQLAGPEPTVLILHSHATESYTLSPGETDPAWDGFRTLSLHQNMVAVGDHLKSLLEMGGIGVIHDQRLHDYPSYSDAYTNSRQAVQAYLQQYPSIQLVLDLHRDAALNPDGSQYATAAWVDGQRSAQLMLVMGSGQYAWQENLSAALKLQVVLEQRAPGITRPTVLRAQRFNQDLLPSAMLVEVGTAGNTLHEALLAVSVLAEAILILKNGANATENSTS